MMIWYLDDHLGCRLEKPQHIGSVFAFEGDNLITSYPACSMDFAAIDFPSDDHSGILNFFLDEVGPVEVKVKAAFVAVDI